MLDTDGVYTKSGRGLRGGSDARIAMKRILRRGRNGGQLLQQRRGQGHGSSVRPSRRNSSHTMSAVAPHSGGSCTAYSCIA